MGREIRRVPAGWDHPRDERGRYQPLYDSDFDTEVRKWKEGLLAWETDPRKQEECCEYWEWDNGPPERAYYRPAWTDEERTHYQIYETVSEGTPVSPVFETEDQMTQWLVGQGYSEHAAAEFVNHGFAFSMVISKPADGGQPTFAENIHAFDLPGPY